MLILLTHDHIESEYYFNENSRDAEAIINEAESSAKKR